MADALDVQVQLRSYFPTPVAIATIGNGERLNAELKRIILARAETHPSVQHSNLGGWQSSWDFAEWGGQPARAVVDLARALGDKLTADRAGKPAGVPWKVNSWANVNRSGHANEFHTHPGAFWSASYYVDDGGCSDPALGGEFEIQDPRGVAPAMYAPLLAFAFPGGQSAGGNELLRPETGTLVMFPAWLSHGVRPYKGAGVRISVALNLSL